MGLERLVAPDARHPADGEACRADRSRPSFPVSISQRRKEMSIYLAPAITSVGRHHSPFGPTRKGTEAPRGYVASPRPRRGGGRTQSSKPFLSPTSPFVNGGSFRHTYRDKLIFPNSSEFQILRFT